jgi:hypothetical protein
MPGLFIKWYFYAIKSPLFKDEIINCTYFSAVHKKITQLLGETIRLGYRLFFQKIIN